MQDLIQEISENAGSVKDVASVSALYDKYAPAVYGRILKVVKQKEIAEKILERVFIAALNDKNQSGYLTPFTSLFNSSRKKTYGTMKALRMFEALSCGQKSIITAD